MDSTYTLSAQKRVRALSRHLTASPSDNVRECVHRSVSSASTASDAGPSDVPAAGLMSGQVAIVTGSGQGIGRATALLFAAQGGKVVVSDLDAQKGDAVAAEICRRYGSGSAIAINGNVLDKDYPERVTKGAFDKWGKLTCLVLNAGYTYDGVVHKMSDKQWQAMLDIHNTAPFRLIRAASPYMREPAKKEIADNGRAHPRSIVFISSTSGLHGNAGQVNYAAGKSAVLGMTKTLAKEWGSFGIRVNAVAFGFIKTRLTESRSKGETIQVDGKEVKLGIPGGMSDFATMLIPLRRAGAPDEAAAGILLVASPFASYITGHTLEVTGGAGI